MLTSAALLGVAPGATIIPIRQTGADGKGDSESLAAGIEDAIASVDGRSGTARL